MKSDATTGAGLTPRQFAVEIVTRLREAGCIAYWAGGCVRDLLLGQPPKDYDVATDARPEQVRALFGHKRTRAVGASFGVILVHGFGEAGDIEVATFRSEGPYLDGRHPEHVTYSTPEEDAHRRDFTINGMFYDPVAARVLDYVGGEEDLKRQIIRAIGNPLERFAEDKLRLLRAIRFAANLAFTLDAATADAIRLMAPEIRVVSAERIAQEWKRILSHPRRALALRLARETQLLVPVFPESAPQVSASGDADRLWEVALHAIERLPNPSFELVLSTWLCDTPGYSAAAARAMCLRLRLSNDELDRIVWLKAHADDLNGLSNAALCRVKRLLAHPFFPDLLAQTRARMEATGGSLADVEFSEQYLRSTPADVINPPLLITGDDLIRGGLRPGKQFKQLLENLRDAQLDGQVTTCSEALALALRLAGQ